MKRTLSPWRGARAARHVFVCLILGMWASSASVGARTATPDWDAIDRYVEAEMASDRVPGVALAIVQGDQIVHMRGFGFDGTGGMVSPQSSFILGSMSKSFSALALMQLVEQEKVALDAPVQRYLPWFRVADEAASARITVQEVLNHTSGIPANAPQARGADASIEDHVRALAGVRLVATPGTRYEYSSPNYLVVGAVIEQVSGQPFSAYVEEHIFGPLRMTHSFTSLSTAGQNGLALGHRYLFGFPQIARLPYAAGRMPTASIISSAEDLARFLIAHLDGGTYDGARVLSADGIATMLRGTAQADGFQYAMGWRVGRIGDVDAIHHGGVLPHYRGKLVMVPDGRWGVVVLTNISTLLPVGETSHRMADTIAASLAGTPLPEAGSRLKTVFAVLTVAIVLLTINQAASLVRPHRWQMHMIEQTRRGIVGNVVSELLLPLLLLFGFTRVFGVPWSELLRSMPDIGYWMILTIALGLALGVWKAVVAYGLLRSGAHAPPAARR